MGDRSVTEGDWADVISTPHGSSGGYTTLKYSWTKYVAETSDCRMSFELLHPRDRRSLSPPHVEAIDLLDREPCLDAEVRTGSAVVHSYHGSVLDSGWFTLKCSMRDSYSSTDAVLVHLFTDRPGGPTDDEARLRNRYSANLCSQLDIIRARSERSWEPLITQGTLLDRGQLSVANLLSPPSRDEVVTVSAGGESGTWLSISGGSCTMQFRLKKSETISERKFRFLAAVFTSTCVKVAVPRDLLRAVHAHGSISPSIEKSRKWGGLFEGATQELTCADMGHHVIARYTFPNEKVSDERQNDICAVLAQLYGTVNEIRSLSL